MSKIQDANKEKVNARRELTPDELDAVNGGKPHTGQGIIDFFHGSPAASTTIMCQQARPNILLTSL